MHGTLRDEVHVVLDVFVDLVEQLVQRDELWPLHIPVGLLGLRLQVDAVRQPAVQQGDGLRPDVLGKVVLGLEHWQGSFFMTG